jgi:hypothetical protein
MYLAGNDIVETENDTEPFRQVFQSLPIDAQTLYLMEINNIAHHDEDTLKKARLKRRKVAALKTWVVSQYPPIQSRVDFIKKLKRIRMRRDEDPVIVWNKLRAMMAQVIKAINTINSATWAANRKMPKLSENDKYEICCSIFITNNYTTRNQNDGSINKVTTRYIESQDPQKYDDFAELMKTIHNNITPRCTRGKRKFISYPHTPEDFNPIPQIRDRTKTPTKRSDDPKKKPPTGGNSERKRLRDNNRDRGAPSRKRSKYDKRDKYGKRDTRECHRCHNTGHIEKRCGAIYDYNGKYLGTNPNVPSCSICGRHNHLVHDCRAFKHVDGTTLRNPNSDKGRGTPKPGGFNRYGNGNFKGRGGHNKGAPTHKPQSQSLNKEQIQRTVMLLGKAIAGDDAINPEIRTRFNDLTNIVRNGSNPRPSS